MIQDPILDNKRKVEYLQKFLGTFFITEGKKNIEYDLTLKNGVTIELKSRQDVYEDVIVEITQYSEGCRNNYFRRKDSDIYKQMIRKEEKTEHIVNWLQQSAYGWAWHCKADYIVYVNPRNLYFFDWKKMKKYMIENFDKLDEVSSYITTGAINKILPVDEYYTKHKIQDDFSELWS